MLILRGAWLYGMSSVPQGSDLSRLRSSLINSTILLVGVIIVNHPPKDFG